jgi:hypothetical protein
MQGRTAWKHLYSLSNYSRDPRLVRNQLLTSAALAACWSLSILTRSCCARTNEHALASMAFMLTHQIIMHQFASLTDVQ